MQQPNPLTIALSYIERGWPVFPVRAKDEEAIDRRTGQTKYNPETGEVEVLKVKTPYTDSGFKSATRFKHILERWWSDWPDAMIGVPTGEQIGAWVLDVDPRHDGHITLEALEAEHGPLPATLSATTASGGKHFYFRFVDGVRNRGNFGPGLDVRGTGGYCVAPGSITAAGGRYEWDNDLEPVDAPDWLLSLVVRKEQPNSTHVSAPNANTNSAYVNAAVDRELADLAGAPRGNRNNKLNDSSFCLGTLVGAGAIPESEARALLQDVARGWGRDWSRCCKTIENGLDAGKRNPREIPAAEYNEDDNTRLVNVTRMIENGLRKAKERAAAPVNDNKQEHNEPQEPPRKPAIVFTPFKWIEPSTLPRREFAFGTHYIRKYVSVTVAPGGLGKTANSIVEALSMVSGRPLAGTKPDKRLRVQIFNSEDPRDELQRRIMAVCIRYNLRPDDVRGLFLDTGREQELVVAVDDKRTGVRIVQPIVEAVVEQIRANEIDVMIVDPFVSTHQVNENDNGAIDKVAKLWAQIADQTNCAIDIVHHLRKLADREATVEDARGAVSLIGAARSVRVLNRMSSDQATKAGLEEDDRFGYFSINYGKSNLTKLSHKLDWRFLESVPLGNGGTGLDKAQDHAPVVTEWKWPSKEEIAEAIPDNVREMVMVRLANQNGKKSDQAEDWAGYILADAMGVQIEASRGMTPEKRRIKAALDSWLENGILEEFKEHDPRKGRDVTFIRPKAV